MSTLDAWIRNLQTAATTWQTQTGILVALHDEYEARGGADWIATLDRPSSEFTNEDIEALMGWVPSMVAGLTPEVKAALYSASDVTTTGPTAPTAQGGTVVAPGTLPPDQLPNASVS